MIIMPSLTALAGRAGDWDRAFISAAKLRRGALLGLCTAPQNSLQDGENKHTAPCRCNVNGSITPGREKKSEWRMK